MSGSPGFGVMVNRLFGNPKHVGIERYIGKTISSVALKNNKLLFEFSDGERMKIWDDGQSCCEKRYMVCDDNLANFSGAKLLGAEVQDAPPVQAEYEEHEVQFLKVHTSIGDITASNHNEHNGYYGGFSMIVEDASDKEGK